MRTVLLTATLLLWAPAVRAEAKADPSRTAIEKGLRRLEQGAANYVKNRQCFSCHHQAMAILGLSAARQRGFKVDDTTVRKQIEFTLEHFKKRKDRVVKGQGVEGASTMAVYALFALDGAGHPADETTAALVQYLLLRQKSDGSFPALAKRPPSEGSLFTNAALALRGLRKYGPARDAKGADELRARIAKAIDKAREWLKDNEPETMEDKIFHLRALVDAGAEKKDVAAARDRLLKEQRKDGGWSQLPQRESDAYATGAVLTALRLADLQTRDPAYWKGVKYLLATQRDDGAWLVPTRTQPLQVFFDNGDPGGKSQFISFTSTAWAVLALLEQFPEKK